MFCQNSCVSWKSSAISIRTFLLIRTCRWTKPLCDHQMQCDLFSTLHLHIIQVALHLLCGLQNGKKLQVHHQLIKGRSLCSTAFFSAFVSAFSHSISFDDKFKTFAVVRVSRRKRIKGNTSHIHEKRHVKVTLITHSSHHSLMDIGSKVIESTNCCRKSAHVRKDRLKANFS